MHDSLKNAREYLQQKDSLRRFLSIVVILIPFIIAVLSFLTEQEDYGVTFIASIIALLIIALFAGLTNLFLAPKEFFQAVFAYEDLEKEYEKLENTTASALQIPTRLIALAQTGDLAQSTAQDPAWTRKTWSINEIQEKLKTILQPFVAEFPRMYEYEPDDKFNLTIYLVSESRDLLKCVYRFRDFEGGWETEPSRDWPTDGEAGGHVSLAYNLKRTISSSDIWQDDSCHVENGKKEKDEDLYVSMVSSPLFSKGSESDKVREVRGVVCVTSSRRGHFGPDAMKYKTFTKLLAAFLTPCLDGVTIGS